MSGGGPPQRAAAGPPGPVVFLHIPKTGGQTIHAALAQAVGAAAVSPVRVHGQADAAGQMPPGYRLYSGHIDWGGLTRLPPGRFAFTVLRDPLERIASFYFYMLHEAGRLGPAELALPAREGMRRILARGPDDYFFGGGPDWQAFVRDHYDNFYCAYLATGRVRGGAALAGLPASEVLARALAGAGRLDRVCALEDLAPLEADLGAHLGVPVRLSGRRENLGPLPQGTPRWPRLCARLARDASRARLERFAERDAELMRRLGLG